MQKMETLKRTFCIACAGVAVSAAALFSILFQSGDVMKVLIGIAFWAGVLLEIAAVIAAVRRMKTLPAEQRLRQQKMHAGLISFGKTKAGMAADLLFLLSAIVMIIMICCKVNNAAVIMTVIVLIYLGFHFHCLCNGKIFRILNANAHNREEKRK